MFMGDCLNDQTPREKNPHAAALGRIGGPLRWSGVRKPRVRKLDHEKNPDAVAFGRLGGLKGGPAKKAAEARRKMLKEAQDNAAVAREAAAANAQASSGM
jgi:hypothetical protein